MMEQSYSFFLYIVSFREKYLYHSEKGNEIITEKRHPIFKRSQACLKKTFIRVWDGTFLLPCSMLEGAHNLFVSRTFSSFYTLSENFPTFLPTPFHALVCCGTRHDIK